MFAIFKIYFTASECIHKIKKDYGIEFKTIQEFLFLARCNNVDYITEMYSPTNSFVPYKRYNYRDFVNKVIKTKF